MRGVTTWQSHDYNVMARFEPVVSAVEVKQSHDYTSLRGGTTWQSHD